MQRKEEMFKFRTWITQIIITEEGWHWQWHWCLPKAFLKSTMIQSDWTAQCTYPLHFPQIYRELGAPQCGVWSPQCWTLDIIGLNTVLWRRRGRYFVVPRGEADAIWRTWGLTFGLSKMMNNTSGILIDNLLITFGLSKMINTTVMWSSSTISSSLLDCQRCLKCCLIIQFCL